MKPKLHPWLLSCLGSTFDDGSSDPMAGVTLLVDNGEMFYLWNVNILADVTTVDPE